MPELKSFEEYWKKTDRYICPDCGERIGCLPLGADCMTHHTIYHAPYFEAMREMLEAQRQAILSLQKEVEELKKQLKPNN